MKQFVSILTAAMLLLSVLCPVAAAPYTEQELEEYMQAIYCEQVWAQDFPDFQVQFIDIDLDGRKEMVTMEVGEAYAPKKAHVYAFMDTELSGRGGFEVGQLLVCRDPDTHESFIVNRIEKDGRLFHQRLSYNRNTETISLQGLTDDYAAQLEDHGYTPVWVTKAQWETFAEYADYRAVFLPAYQNTVCVNGEPPVVEPTEGDSVSTYIDPPTPVDMTPYWIAGGVVAAAVVVTTAAVLVVRRRATKRR